MKNLVLQVNISNNNCYTIKDTFKYVQEMYEVSGIMAKRYAQRTNADYYVVTDKNDWQPGKDKHLAYQKLKVYDFKEYDAILYLDSDYIIKDNAPNVFEEFQNTFCAVVQNKAGNSFLKKLDIPEDRYPNTGFMYYPKWFLDQTRDLVIHKYIKFDFDLCDQDLLGKVIHECNIDFVKLNQAEWNPETTFGKYGDHYGGKAKKMWGSVKYF